MSLTVAEVEVVRARLKTWPWKTLKRWYEDVSPQNDDLIGERFENHIAEHG